MLDRTKLIKELRAISADLFLDHSAQYTYAQDIWQIICNDPLFVHRVKSAPASWSLPWWSDSLAECIEVPHRTEPYRVLGVDGSQIYPDKHQGTLCFLINIGSVLLSYGIPDVQRVMLETEPHVFVGGSDDGELEATTEVVNCRRQEYELQKGLTLGRKLIEASDAPLVFLCDGSLIFWHLESKDIQLKHTFLSCYIALLQQLYDSKIPTAGYISLPKSKELVSLIRYYVDDQPAQPIDQVVDAAIMKSVLSLYHRSIVFKSNSSICALYPEHLRPYFVYIHLDNEIGRIEFPAWIAQDQHYLDLVCSIVLDQSRKGNGYPIVLAESHEQAVVKGPDREFFYQVIQKIGIERNERLLMSQKSIKKRAIGI